MRLIIWLQAARFLAAALAIGLSNTLIGKSTSFAADSPFFDVEAAPGVFVHFGQIAMPDSANQNDIANITLIVGKDAAAIVDAGGSPAVGRRLLAAVKAITPKPVRYVISTHEHPDHVFGNPALAGSGATFVGHAALPQSLASRWDHYQTAFGEQIGPESMQGETLVTPALLVQDKMTLDLGGRELELTAWYPAAHSDCDLTVLDRSTGTLIAGDLLFMQFVPVVDGSAKSWLSILTQMRNIPAARVIPGHGRLIGEWPSAMDAETAYLQTLVADTRKAIAAGTPLEQAIETIAASQRGVWQLFDEFNRRNAIAAFTELEWE
jgi:quinoprotein relay system zinc metallohydrolase 2